MNRRQLLGAAGATSLSLAFHAKAQSFPERPIRLVVSYPPGGSSDAIMRWMIDTPPMKINGHPMFVDNRPGAGTIIGTQTVFSAKPDGHTIGMVDAQFMLNAFLRPDLPYKADDFSYIAMLGAQPMVMVVPADVKGNTPQEIIDNVLNRSKKISYGVWGIGAINHLAALDLLSRSHIQEAVAVPYPGGAAMAQAITVKDIDFAILDITSAEPFVDSGRVRIVAHSGAPDVGFRNFSSLATIFPSYEWVPMGAIVGPKNIAKEQVQVLSSAIKDALAVPRLREQMISKGFFPGWQSPEDTKASIQQTMKKFGEAAKKFDVRIK